MSLKPLTCIIVEDELAYQHVLIHLLKKMEGIEVLDVCADTVSAARSIEKKKPDVVLLDINISGLDGPEFMELLEHQPRVIIISGYDESYMRANYSLPYDAYVRKPATAEQLAQAFSGMR